MKIYDVAVDKVIFSTFIMVGFIFNRDDIVTTYRTTPLKYFVWFSMYALLVNSAYAVYYSNSDILYNGLTAVALSSFSIVAYNLLKREELTLRVIVASGLFTLIFTYISYYFGYSKGFFENPNQLARFTVFFVSILGILISLGAKLPSWLMPLSFGVGVSLCTINERRAGLLGMTILFGILCWKNYRLAISSGLAGVLFSALLYTLSSKSLTRNTSRLVERFSENQVDDSILGRGLSRVIDFPHYLLLGSGEGLYGRFTSIGSRHYEIHSTYINVLFCYGIIGFLLFIYYQYKMVRSQIFSLWWVLPILGFTIFHNDLRSIYFLVVPLILYIGQPIYKLDPWFK